MKKVKPEDFNLLVKLPDLYLYLDPELYILNATDAYLEATLTVREEIIGKHVFEIFPDNPDVEEIQGSSNLQNSLDYVINNKTSHEINVHRYDIRKPDGEFELRYWKPMSTPVLNEEGDLLFIIHKVEDVTGSVLDKELLATLVQDKEQKEEKERQDLISAEAQRKVLYGLSVESPFAMGIFKGSDYIIELANPALCNVWGMQPSDIMGKPLFEAIPGLVGQGFKELLDEVRKTGLPFIGKELPVVIKSAGEEKTHYYDLIYHPITGANGKVQEITVTATDVTSVVTANKEARESKERFQQLLENLPEITWTAIPTGEIIFYNQKWYKYTGLSYEETKNWGWEKVVHPEDFPHTMEVYSAAIASGKKYEVELRLKRGRDECYRWHLARAVPFKDPEGKITLWLGTTTDIHDLKTAEVELLQLRAREEELLKESENERKRLHNLFMEAPAMITSLKGPDHIFEMVNPLYQKLYGDRVLLGRPVRDALPEYENQGIFEMFDEVYNTGKSYVGKEVPYIIPGKKEPRYFNLINKATHNAEGVIEGIIAFGYEVTDQVVARKQLEESEQRLRIAQEAAQVGTFEWDLTTNKIKFTPQVEVIFGYPPGAWKGEYANALKIIHPDDKKRIEQENENVVKNKKPMNIEHRIVRPDGEIRWLNSKGEVFSDNKGNPVRVFGVIIDITERKEAEQALERKNKELTHINSDLDNFIYVASHDLRAPISNLEGLLNAFGQDADFNTDQKAMVEMMVKSVHRLKTTIQDLTEISKVQRVPEEKLELVSFDDIWNEVKQDISETINQFQPKIMTDFKVSKVNYSRKNLRSILYNLVSNAIKYSSPDRKPLVKISTVKTEDCIVLKVSDNGLGLSPEDQQKVFGMFKRAHQHVEGSGIGLYVIKRMVVNSGGKIEIESELGKGATFNVQLTSC